MCVCAFILFAHTKQNIALQCGRLLDVRLPVLFSSRMMSGRQIGGSRCEQLECDGSNSNVYAQEQSTKKLQGTSGR